MEDKKNALCTEKFVFEFVCICWHLYIISHNLRETDQEEESLIRHSLEDFHLHKCLFTIYCRMMQHNSDWALWCSKKEVWHHDWQLWLTAALIEVVAEATVDVFLGTVHSRNVERRCNFNFKFPLPWLPVSNRQNAVNCTNRPEGSEGSLFFR